MAGRVVLITGANGGLGTFVTQRFLRAGDTVIGVSRKITQSDFKGGNFIAESVDLNDLAAAQSLVHRIIERFKRIDVVVHTVGGFAGGTALHETGEKTWTQMQDQNLTSAFLLAKAVIPEMRKGRNGRFIAVGSKAAEHPHANLGAYVVFKSALVTFVQTLAIENAAFGITANIVLPGTMDTPGNRAAMPNVDPKSWVPPGEVANAIYWLAGDEAVQVNGATIPVSGRDV
jgi:NAD(P)-dependent dehydrogenase (short-subunit alcohol dehydrogenase family)